MAGGWWVEGEFFAVLLEVESLHFGGEGADGVAGLFFEWSAVDCDGVACDFHGAFGAGEEEAFALFAAVDEVDAEAEIEAFGIVERVPAGHRGHRGRLSRSAGRRWPWRGWGRQPAMK